MSVRIMRSNDLAWPSSPPLGVGAGQWFSAPSEDWCAGSVAGDIGPSIGLEGKVSSGSGRHGILVNLLGNMPFCSKYYIVGAPAMRLARMFFS
jgi:hypothetical protein